MSASVLFAVVTLYFGGLLAVAWRTSRRADSQSFFIGNRRSPWPLVAFGMVGTSLSGVTFWLGKAFRAVTIPDIGAATVMLRMGWPVRSTWSI